MKCWLLLMYGLYIDDVKGTCSPITDTMCVKYKKKNLLLFWACKSRVVTKTLNIVTVIHPPQSLGWVPIHSWTIIHDFYWTFIKHNKNIGLPRHYPTNWKNTYIKYSLSIINYQRSCIQIYTYINLRKSQLHNRIDNN
jgi:hypothetical protein